MITTHPLFGRWRSPFSWADLGQPDVGKTFNLVNTWREQAVYLTPRPRSLERVIASMGFDVERYRIIKIQSLEDLNENLKKLTEAVAKSDKAPGDRAWFAAAVDEGTVLAHKTWDRIIAKIPADGDGTFRRWDKFKTTATRQVVLMEEAPFHVHMNFHLAEAKEMDDGTTRPGGVDVGGPSIAKVYFRNFHVIGFAEPQANAWPRKVAYTGRQPDPDIQLKDRHDFLRGVRPFCGRAILTHLGYRVGKATQEEEELTLQFEGVIKDTAWSDLDSYMLQDRYRKVVAEVSQAHPPALWRRCLFNATSAAWCRDSFIQDLF